MQHLISVLTVLAYYNIPSGVKTSNNFKGLIIALKYGIIIRIRSACNSSDMTYDTIDRCKWKDNPKMY